MKLSREGRIGLMVAISILVFFAGFYFLKGSSVFSRENTYYAYYDNVEGLQPSAVVQIKGLQVGKVSGITLNGADRVKVTLEIPKSTVIPRGTVAKLVSVDLLGTKGIRLELGTSKDPVDDEERLASTVEGGIIDKLSAEITPLLLDVRHVVGVFDSVVSGFSNTFDQQTKQNLQEGVAALKVTTQNFSEMSQRLNRESGALAATIRNANSITANLASNNENINQTLTNLHQVSGQLSGAPLQATINDLQTTVSQLNILMEKINRGDGSLGMVVNDKQLYEELTASLNNLKFLMADLKSNPSRYINISIFGRRNRDK
jgi:phospholipid/cholesterol/gamma-HCH transport system substrate-binding protein